MSSLIISKDEVNTGRQREIDLLKAYSIIMMIITHCIDELFDYEGHIVSVVIDDILAQSVGAQGFMICMGIGVVYAGRGRDSKALSKGQIKRGISLLVTGQLLNLIRYALPYFIAYIKTGDALFRTSMFLVFSSDILQFAGLFFILIGLLYRLKFRSAHVFMLSIIMTIAGMLTCGRIATESYAFDQLLGLFIFTNTESYFPLFHWMIFPAFGMVYGDVLLHVNDKKKFYGRLLILTTIVFVIYYYFGLRGDQNVFTVFKTWQSFSYMSIYDAFMQLFCNTAVICICFFITEPLSKSAMRPIEFVSKNINRYYCVHSVLIYYAATMLEVLSDGKFESAALCYIAALVIMLLTTLVVIIYGQYFAKPIGEIITSHRGLFYTLVIIASVLACVYAGKGVEWDYGSFPNMMNDYISATISSDFLS